MKDSHFILDAASTTFKYIKDKYNLDEQQYKALVCVLKYPACGLEQVSLYLSAPLSQVKGVLNVLYVFGFILSLSPDAYTLTSKGSFVLDDISMYFRLCQA